METRYWHFRHERQSVAQDRRSADSIWATAQSRPCCGLLRSDRLLTELRFSNRLYIEINMVTPATDDTTNKQQVTIWQIVMLFLCVYVLGALFVDTIFRLPEQTSILLNQIDNAICLIFIGDFVINVIKARSKLGYLKWGWIDLVSSIPNVQILRWGRFVRIIRIMRILRGLRSTRQILKFLFANRAKGTFASVAMISFVLMVSSSIAILNCETSPDSNIQSASDALWWSFVTITTVGYGDFYPITLLGRIIAAVLMTAGVGLFGTFTAYVASSFLQQEDDEQEEREDRILAELESI
jgi:voltage-gated potassium channel